MYFNHHDFWVITDVHVFPVVKSAVEGTRQNTENPHIMGYNLKAHKLGLISNIDIFFQKTKRTWKLHSFSDHISFISVKNRPGPRFSWRATNMMK